MSLLSSYRPRKVSSPPLYISRLPGPADWDDGTSLCTLLPPGLEGKAWTDFDPVPAKLVVVDSVTREHLTDVPCNSKRERVALLDPGGGYLALVPRTRRSSPSYTTFLRLESHIPPRRLGYQPRRGRLCRVSTLPFLVGPQMFAPPHVARWTGKEVRVYHVDTGELVQRSSLALPADLASRLYVRWGGLPFLFSSFFLIFFVLFD